MGTFTKERLIDPGAWEDVEIDLMRPYTCHGDVNKHSMMKIWGAVLEDVNSGAVYCDVILNYSTEAVLLILK